ncbi:UNVERIFIED_CONTAM: hypothetical protein Sangu_2153800 [Sesamum angustifolium]|uniref:CCHC-type domain-containing protein n=1 Tax=Sesamum angustifolium TaxID=2727405 RepID=A0AAW2LG74_9LAMI
MEVEGVNEGVDEEIGVGAEAEGVNEEFGLGAKAEGVNEGVGEEFGVGAEAEGVNEAFGLYCCFRGLKKGVLDGCRPFIGLDGYFLKGMHKGQLLSAIVAAINYHRQNLEDSVHPYFKKDTCLRLYSHMINPVPGMLDYEESPLGLVDPPHVVKMVGRPKKERGKDANDIREPTRVSRRGLTHTCAICGKQGHNKRKCTFRQMPIPPFSQETAAESFPISEHIPQQMPAYKPQSIPQHVPRILPECLHQTSKIPECDFPNATECALTCPPKCA